MYMLLVYIRDRETSYSKPTNIQFLERQGKSLIIHVQNYFLLEFAFFSLYYFLWPKKFSFWFFGLMLKWSLNDIKFVQSVILDR